MEKVFLLVLICTVLSSCAGLGAEKKATVIPDEFSISIDANPLKGWEIDEVTGGIKWKLK